MRPYSGKKRYDLTCKCYGCKASRKSRARGRKDHLHMLGRRTARKSGREEILEELQLLWEEEYTGTW